MSSSNRTKQPISGEEEGETVPKVSHRQRIQSKFAKGPQRNTNVGAQPKHFNNQPVKKTGLAASLGTPIPRGSNPDAFKPKALSTNATPERSDPMLLDAILVEGVGAAIACARERKFLLDFSQYIQLIRSSYLVMTRLDRGLQKYLSLSTYQYYSFVLLWKRLRYVLTERGNGVNEYESLIRKLPPLAVPDELGHYLDGIGNVIDYDSCKYYLNVQDDLRNNLVIGLTGHYGRVDAVSHLSYETLPSPFVSMFRMLQDIAQTKASQQRYTLDPAWNLPVELCPEGNSRPNKNLLGWDLSSPLTSEQYSMLTGAGLDVTLTGPQNVPPNITYDTGTVENFGGVPILYQVLLQVSELLSGSKSPYNNHASSTGTHGSIAQCGFIERDLCDVSHNVTGPSLPPLYTRNGTLYVFHASSPHACSAGSLFRYRLKRRVHGTNDCLCYLGPHGGAPDPTWLTNANDVFNSVHDWNRQDFRTIMTSGRLLADAYSERIRKMTPREG